MAEENKVTFVTQYRGLELVHTPMGTNDLHDNKIPSKRCLFSASKYGCTFSTSDKEMIDWLKKHDYFKRGKIQLLNIEDCVITSNATQVVRGGLTTATGKDQTAVATPSAKEQGTEPRRARVVR